MQQNKIYVGNLSFSVTRSEIEDAFSPYGELEDVQIIMDRDTGQSRGFAFVVFKTQLAAESALKMNGQALGGRNLIVNMAKERAPRRRRY